MATSDHDQVGRAARHLVVQTARNGALHHGDGRINQKLAFEIFQPSLGVIHQLSEIRAVIDVGGRGLRLNHMEQ